MICIVDRGAYTAEGESGMVANVLELTVAKGNYHIQSQPIR